jgi:uncharacterized protein YndB with AHSA1/START domain
MTTETNISATADREIVLSRLLKASRERVWEVWTNPEKVAVWWGPNGFTNTIHSMEVKPGGVWLFDMLGPDGTNYPNKIVYSEVVRPERLVYVHGDGNEGGRSFHVTVTFEEREGGTLLTMRSIFGTAEEREKVVKEYGAIEGGQQTISKLEEYLRR